MIENTPDTQRHIGMVRVEDPEAGLRAVSTVTGAVIAPTVAALYESAGKVIPVVTDEQLQGIKDAQSQQEPNPQEI